MKVVILCGGLGSRLSEKTEQLPKPLIEIGGKPILWHIMQRYAMFGFTHFILAAGYLQETLKNYFLNFYHLNHDLKIDLKTGKIQKVSGSTPNWTVEIIDTGLNTQTGGRLKRLKNHLSNETFMMTYGDGLCDVDLQQLLNFHKAYGKLSTVTAVHPPPRFGGMSIENSLVKQFSEKPREGWINGGYFVLEPEAFEYIASDETMWEKSPLENLSRDSELAAFQHEGFWQPMDTLRDHRFLEDLYQKGEMPWLKKKELLV